MIVGTGRCMEASKMRYQPPDWLTKSVFNPLLMLLSRLGVSLRGSRTLAVRGRRSGEWRTVPVNPLPIDSGRYLVSPRGRTDWVRNIRAAGGGELRHRGQAEPIRVTEIADDDKPPILREYLRRWSWEVGKFFDGVTADSSEDDLRRIAPDHAVFRIE
jgi:deazaflavin-dependent oxidoreductase (nitroreductase family)